MGYPNAQILGLILVSQMKLKAADEKGWNPRTVLKDDSHAMVLVQSVTIEVRVPITHTILSHRGSKVVLTPTVPDPPKQIRSVDRHNTVRPLAQAGWMNPVYSMCRLNSLLVFTLHLSILAYISCSDMVYFPGAVHMLWWHTLVLILIAVFVA